MNLRRAAALALLAVTPAAGSQASEIAAKARQAEKKGQISQAYLLYSEASSLQPGNKLYRNKAAALQTRAALASKVVPQDTDGDEAEEPVDIAPYFDNITAREMAAARPLQPPPELHARPGRYDLNFEGDYKSLYQQIAAFYQLEVIFDSEFDAGRRLRFTLDQADYREAIHGLESITGTFAVPVSQKVFLAAKDTPQKRTDLEQTMTVIIPVPQALTQQELVEVAQAVRQTMGIDKLAWDSKSNSVVLRDRVSRVVPAQALFQDLLSYRPEVMVELQLIEIRKSDALNYGVSVPNVFNINFTGQSTSANSPGNTLPASTQNPFPFNSRSFAFIASAIQGGSSSIVKNVFRGLFPNSLTLFSIGIEQANALANFSTTLGRTMLQTDLRAVDGMPATFHIGDKYPILTGSYSAGTSVGKQYVPPPSFTFEDLGVSIKITPHIHGTEAVTLDVESEFKLLSGAAVNGNPIISNRKLKSTVSLREEEWGVVAGLGSKSDARTMDGTMGLSQIPLIGRLFQKRTRQKDSSDFIVLLKPRLVSLPGNQTVTKDVRVGSETRPFTPL